MCVCVGGSGPVGCISYCCGSLQTDASSTSTSGQSNEERDETSCEYHVTECAVGQLPVLYGHGVCVCEGEGRCVCVDMACVSVCLFYFPTAISTASFSAFDYEMMDPLEHDWIMSAVQCSHETSQRLVETEPNFINKRVRGWGWGIVVRVWQCCVGGGVVVGNGGTVDRAELDHHP